MSADNPLVVGFWWDWVRLFSVAFSITALYHFNRKDYLLKRFIINMALTYFLVGNLVNYILGRIVSTFGVQ